MLLSLSLSFFRPFVSLFIPPSPLHFFSPFFLRFLPLCPYPPHPLTLPFLLSFPRFCISFRLTIFSLIFSLLPLLVFILRHPLLLEWKRAAATP